MFGADDYQALFTELGGDPSTLGTNATDPTPAATDTQPSAPVSNVNENSNSADPNPPAPVQSEVYQGHQHPLR